jgi:hypothetical protein
MATYIPWHPGVSNIKDMMLDKYTVPQQDQFVQWTIALLFLSLTGCIQCIALNGINFVLHDTSFILQWAAHLPKGYIFSLYRSNMPTTEYCQVKCLWEFTIKLARRIQWDPGVTVFLHSYTTILPIVSHFSRIKWQPLWIGSNISIWWKSSEEHIT